MIKYACINGNIVLINEAKIGINDLAILRGYGVFDYFKTVNGTAVWLDDHLDRLFYSAGELGMTPGYNKKDLTGLIKDLTNKNGLANFGTRITITGGYSDNGYSMSTPNILITQEAFTYDRHIFNRGISLVTHEHQRQLSHVKTIDYLQAIRLQSEIKARGADDVLYCNESGMVRECPRANFFMIRDGEVVTPASGVLAGITRKKILGLTRFTSREQDINFDGLATADEAFITSTSKIVLPVLQINGKPVGDGQPGKLTRAIWENVLEMQGI